MMYGIARRPSGLMVTDSVVIPVARGLSTHFPHTDLFAKRSTCNCRRRRGIAGIFALWFHGAIKAIEDKSRNTFLIHDVMVGEVWVCSGQSNMEFVLSRAAGGKEEAAQANDSNLRLLHVARRPSLKMEEDIDGKWAITDPKSAEKFSAV